MALLRSDAGDVPVHQSGRVEARVRQFAMAVSHRPSPDLDRRLSGFVQNSLQWSLLERLTPFDRAHHVHVVEALLTSGYDDPDLLLAAALHDVGKADGCARVGIVHRVIKVLLGAASPALLERTTRQQTGLGRGLYLAVHHARLGAVLAGQAGASPRCCWLIAHHHDAVERVDDPDLLALIRADEGVPV